jgi:tRNA threonylcarbamoyladenosine biosynthesis protein TsaE
VKIISKSEADTERAGEALARRLPGGSVVALYGGLGAGKTAFVRGMARGMGISCRVSSPTFTIVNEYSGGGRELLHFDMYRLSGAQELLDIGWDDYLARDAVCAVEWSENVAALLPEDRVRVDIARGETDGERVITISGVPEREKEERAK